jgi:beta-lactamase superfamily II metal-dependent hydrolase
VRLHIFQSENGDCLLLEGQDGSRILCDGGMATSMKSFVREHLGRLRDQGQRLDYVYISHIDQDHISGVLQLLEDELEWRVFDHHHNLGDNEVHQPDVPRPPEIGGIWHNAFRDQVSQNTGDIEDLLAAAAPSLIGTKVDALKIVGEDLADIASSIPEAIKVSRLASPELLGIPVNVLPNTQGPAKLIMRGQTPSFQVGALHITVIGPGKQELKNLLKGWNTWLHANLETVKKIKAELKRRAEQFSNGQLKENAFDLGGWNGIPDYKSVTAPNIASLMLLVEEDGKRLLLTGDGQQNYILEGLKAEGFLSDDALHLDVLKVQHHGSEHNIDADFCRVVSADHYVFCGNGKHGNPELTVLEDVFNSRLGKPASRTKAPEAQDRPFTFWFSTSSANPKSNNEGFDKIAQRVNQLVARSNGLLTARFNEDDVQTLEV